MPWHKVVIRHDEQARWSAAALMRPFIMGYHEHGSTPPANAVLYHGLTDTGDHVYYFSPEASAIALATKAFQTFDVTPCAEQPHLDGCEKVTIRQERYAHVRGLDPVQPFEYPPTLAWYFLLNQLNTPPSTSDSPPASSAGDRRDVWWP